MVVPISTKQCINIAIAIQRVIARATVEQAPPSPIAQEIIARTPSEGVVSMISVEPVVAITAL